MLDFKGKVVLVTGSGRGIGKVIALSFAKLGAKLALCDVNEETLKETVSEIESIGSEAVYSLANVVSGKEVEEMVDKVIDKWGQVDVLINNAGITRDGLLLRMKEEDWDAVLSVNLKGTFNVTKSALKYMMKKRSGRIVNIASVIGVMGNAGQANYAASKGGVIAFTKSVAKESASRGITANAIAPGFIKTKMTEVLSDDVKEKLTQLIPLKRLGEPRDVANACVFLASDMASYITGQVILVDGGMIM